MSRRQRNATAVLALGLSGMLVGFGVAAWACVPMATVQATPTELQPGQEVAVSGIRFIGFGPVTIRLNSLDGPILATVPMGPTSNTIFKASVTIPPGTPPGPAVLIALQEPEPGGLVSWGVPARTVVTVTGADGTAPPPAPTEVLARSAGLSRASVGTGAFVAVAAGVAAAALLVAGALALVAGRVAHAPAEAR